MISTVRRRGVLALALSLLTVLGGAAERSWWAGVARTIISPEDLLWMSR